MPRKLRYQFVIFRFADRKQRMECCAVLGRVLLCDSVLSSGKCRQKKRDEMRKCWECGRIFDPADALDQEEMQYGHDCESDVIIEWDYVHEIRRLLAMPVDADVWAGEREAGPETPDERMATIEYILVCEEAMEWPIDYIRHIDVSHRESGHRVHPDDTMVIQTVN